ncbi:MAG: hypothetical protein HZA77_16245 [Candidatus Schekmanbacteria bacterium]|nr:hypothetical protein [Candidatus Schekmanbacteria bacterium]
MGLEDVKKLRVMIEVIKDAVSREEESAVYYLNKSKAEHFEELNNLFRSLAAVELEHKKDLEELLKEYEKRLEAEHLKNL